LAAPKNTGVRLAGGWRAERLLADQQQRERGGGGTGPVRRSTLSQRAFAGLLAGVQHKLSEMKANRDELRQGSTNGAATPNVL
jgi:hypothetical protein